MIKSNGDFRNWSWEEMANAILNADTWDEVQDIVDYVIDFFDLEVDFDGTNWEDEIYAWCHKQL